MIPGLSGLSPTSLFGGVGSVGGQTSSGMTSGSATAPGMSFASMVSQTVGDTVSQLKGAEQLSIDALQGKADMRTVVDAVMSAEQSLQAAVAIRDKIVTAYLEVSRMAI